MATEKREIGILIWAILATIAVIVLFLRQPGMVASNIRLMFPNGSGLEMQMERETPYETILDSMYAHDFARFGLMGWLADKGIFHFSDAMLVDSIHSGLCDTIPSEPIDKKMKSSRECADQPIAQGLRSLANDKQVPFHYLGIAVKVGFPPKGSRPIVGRANVCKTSPLRGMNVRVINLRTSNSTEVFASGIYTCTGFDRFPDIQLHVEDAEEIFDGPLQEYEDAIAVPLE